MYSSPFGWTMFHLRWMRTFVINLRSVWKDSFRSRPRHDLLNFSIKALFWRSVFFNKRYAPSGRRLRKVSRSLERQRLVFQSTLNLPVPTTIFSSSATLFRSMCTPFHSIFRKTSNVAPVEICLGILTRATSHRTVRGKLWTLICRLVGMLIAIYARMTSLLWTFCVSSETFDSPWL